MGGSASKGEETTSQIIHDGSFLDFENFEVSDEEREVSDCLAAVLAKCDSMLSRLESFKGCEEHLRKAITTPGPETEEAAWNSVEPALEDLKAFYDFSLELGSGFPKLLMSLCQVVDEEDPKTPPPNLSNRQALAKQLAEVFNFMLRFDHMRLVNPVLQADFSYYRRTLNRMRLAKKEVGGMSAAAITDEHANRMALFFAYPTPMMNIINEATGKLFETAVADATVGAVSRERVTLLLATMANVCSAMVSSKEETNMFCLRAMTGSIILFDHLHPQGAFLKRSPIHLKRCIAVLKNCPSDKANDLLDAIRYTTVHLNDADTPASIKRLLA